MLRDWLDPSVEASPAVQRLGLLWLALAYAYAFMGWLS